MKRNISKILKDEISERYKCFLNDNKKKYTSNILERKQTYLRTHVSKLASTINNLFNVEDVTSFNQLTKDNLLFLVELKTKNEKKSDGLYLTVREAERLIMYIDFLNAVFNKNNIFIKYNETELYNIHEMICPYCGNKANFVESNYNAYICPSCHAKASVHMNTAIPTSTLANQELRDLRKKLFSILNSTFNKKHFIYSFIEKIANKKFNHEDGYIGLLSYNDCKKVIYICNYFHEISKALSPERKTRINHYRLMHFFIKNASLTELEIGYLYKKNYSFQEIANKLNLTYDALIFICYKMYGMGCSLAFKRIPLVKSFVIDNKEKLSVYYDDDFNTFYNNVTKENVLKNISSSSTLSLILAYYHRIRIAKKMLEMTDEEFENFKLIK